jgi:hypothetical protein
MSLTKVSYSMITGNVFNVLDYGATGDGTTDDSAAIQAAITAAGTFQIVAGLTPRTILFFPAGVYLCKSTLKFDPFINYEGVRATTANTTSPYSTLTDSRGSIIRAHADIYNNDSATQGVLAYVQTGDLAIRNLTFVGTASINSNPSAGIQWGSSGTGRPFETTTGGTVSGVVVEDCTFYTCRVAWECYNLNDCYFYQCRFESNVTGTSFGYNSVGGGTFQAQFYASVWFANTFGITFTSAPIYDIRVIGGSFEGTAAGQKHVYTVNAAPASNYRLTFSSVNFSHSSNTNTAHFFMAGYFQGSTSRTIVSDCMFTNAEVNLKVGTGTTGFSNWAFNNNVYLFCAFNMEKSTNGTINGGSFYDSPITLNNSNTIDIHDIKSIAISSGSAINVSTANCGDTRIYNNYFNNNTGNIAITNDATNASIFMSNNAGVTASPAVGKIVDNINGIVFANLGTPSNGSMVYCPDGTIANPVASGGTGCYAKRLNGVWIGN